MIFHKISWEEYHRACIDLAKQLKTLTIDKIVAISRGGLVAARILSDLLDIRISHITIDSYQSTKRKKYLTITEVPSSNFNDQTILIVDDVSDTGRTFKRALSYFNNFRVKKETQQAFVKLFKTKEKAVNKLMEVGFKKWELS